MAEAINRLSGSSRNLREISRFWEYVGRGRFKKLEK